MAIPFQKKPGSLSDALAEARAIAGGQSSRPPPPTSISPLAPTVKRVVVVDSDSKSRAVLVAALKALQYEVLEAADGLAAAELCARISAPSLVIADVVLTNLDGFSLARILKAHPLFKGVPIMFVSSRSTPADVTQALALGARQFVSKPYVVNDLIAKIRKIVD